MRLNKKEKKDCSEKAENSAALSTLHSILEPLAPSDTMSQMFERVIERVLAATGADAGLIRVLDRETQSLPCACQRGFPEQYLKLADALSPASASGRVFTTGEPIISPEIASDPRLKGKVQLKVGFRSCAILPLYVSDKVRGIIHLASRRTGYFNEQKRELLMAVARQMGIALENWELLDQSERRAGELAALNTVAAAVSSSLDLDFVLAKVLDTVLKITGMEAGYIQFIDTSLQQLVLKVHKGISPLLAERLRGEIRSGGKTDQIIATKRSLILDDIPLDCAGKFKGQGMTAAVLVPILSRDQVTGVLTVTTRRAPTFPRDKIALLESIASSLGVATENALLFQEVDRRRKHAEVLRDIGLSLTATHDPQQVLEQVAGEARRLVDALFTFVVTPDVPFYKIAAVAGDDQGYGNALKLSDDPASTYGQGPLGQAIRNRAPVICEDVLTDPLFATWREIASARGIRSLVAVPLLGQGKTYGALLTYSPIPRAYDTDTINLLSALATQAAAALENARLINETEKRAMELSALHTVMSAVSGSIELNEVLEKALHAVLLVTGMESGYIRLLEGEPPRLTLKVHKGISSGHVERLRNQTAGSKNTLKVLSTKRSLILEDIQNRPAGELQDMRQEGFAAEAWIPVVSKDRIVGTINLATRGTETSLHEQIPLLESIAASLGVAIENARLYEKVRTKSQELAVLVKVNRDVAALYDREVLLQRIADEARKILNVDASAFRLVEGDSLVLVSGSDPKGLSLRPRLHLDESLSGKVVQENRAIAIKNVLEDTTMIESHREILRKAGCRSFLGIPLRLGDRVIGTINFYCKEEREFQPEEISLVTAFADQAAVAVENANLFHEVELRAQEQSALNSIAMAVNQSLHLDELLQISLDKVLAVSGRERGYIRLKDPTTGELRLAAHRGISEDYAQTLLHHRTPGGKSERVFQSGEPLVINDPERTLLREETRREGNYSIAWIPLKARGKVVGILNISTDRPIPFAPREVQLFQTIGNVIGVALENAQLFEDSNRLVRELEATTQQLSAKNRELDSFVYTVSHDLKAPLITLEGMAALLLDEYGGKLDEEAQHYLQRLMAGSKQMERLIIDLLALSRIGREGQSPEEVSLNQVTEELLLEWGEAIRAKGIRVICHNLPTLLGVRTQVHQVMENLVGNAVKYLGDSPDPMIEIGTKDGAGRMVECYVRDNGIGIDPEYHEKIFEIFQRLKEIEAEGTGVGLAIVKKIVEGAGGRVWVESAKGEGATFRFTWPKTQTEVKP